MAGLLVKDKVGTFELITLAEAKDFLKVSVSDDDTLIGSLLNAARGHAGKYLDRTVDNWTFEQYWDGAPAGQYELRAGGVIGFTSLEYKDGDGDWQTFPADDYEVDLVRRVGRIWFKSQPGANTDEVYNRVRATYTAGYETAADVPSEIVSAIYLILGHLYENREDVVVGRGVAELPMNSRYLMDQHRLNRFT